MNLPPMVVSAELLALAPAPFCTIQDMGRVGWRRYGVTGAGAMDLESHAIANALAGNPIEAATVEFAHGGGEWTVSGSTVRIAVAGGAFPVSINARPVAAQTSALLQAGERLCIGGARDAVWGYLAVSGGIQVPLDLGSRATYVRGGLGGIDGRHLAAGDVLPLKPVSLQPGERMLPQTPRDHHRPIRVVLGPQADYFDDGSLVAFLSEAFKVTRQADRIGYRLEGPSLRHTKGFNIVSDAILPGSIQVPGSGLPIVLLRDAQTTGGYPKIATIISSDLGRFSQLRPSSAVRFKLTTPDDAQRLRREFIHRVLATRLHVEPAEPAKQGPV